MKLLSRVLRLIFVILGALLAVPTAIIFILLGRLSIIIGRYSEMSLFISRIPFYFGEYTRYFYYKATLKRVGRNVVFKYGSFCQYSNACIGDRVLIGYYSSLGEVSMGDDIVVGGFVNFVSGTTQHSYADSSQPIRSQKAPGRYMITIGSDVWIGSNSIIAANVGSGCVVGAGSVLTKSVEPGTVIVGSKPQQSWKR